MARYERFDDDTPVSKATVYSKSYNENVNLFASSETNEDETITRHALITLNIISIFVSTICGLITFFLAIQEQSPSALGFAVDTILDVLAFAIIIWRFLSSQQAIEREILVLRILATLFLISGFGVFIDSILDLRNRIHPIPNHYLTIAVGVQTVIFLCLAAGKYTVAKKLNVTSAYSDTFNTLISGLTALSITISTTIYNSNINVWYLDPIMGLFISITIMIYGAWMMKKSFKTI